MVWLLFFSVISDNKYKHWGLRWPIKHAGNQTIISQRDGRANSENMLVCQACVGTVIYLICECILLWTLRTRDALGSEIESLASRNRDNGDNTLQLSKCFYLWLVKKKSIFLSDQHQHEHTHEHARTYLFYRRSLIHLMWIVYVHARVWVWVCVYMRACMYICVFFCECCYSSHILTATHIQGP